jgi:hypothetical protein
MSHTLRPLGDHVGAAGRLRPAPARGRLGRPPPQHRDEP